MRLWFTIFLFFSIVMQMSSQSLTALVSSDSILLGNTIILEIKAENVDGNIEKPDLSEFDIYSGPNVSSSIAIINGEKTSSKTLTWYLKPRDLGQYFIAPASIKVDDEYIESVPIEINVYPNPDGIIIEPEQNSMQDFFQLDFNMPPIFGNPQEAPRSPETPAQDGKKKRILKKG